MYFSLNLLTPMIIFILLLIVYAVAIIEMFSVFDDEYWEQAKENRWVWFVLIFSVFPIGLIVYFLTARSKVKELKDIDDLKDKIEKAKKTGDNQAVKEEPAPENKDQEPAEEHKDNEDPGSPDKEEVE